MDPDLDRQIAIHLHSQTFKGSVHSWMDGSSAREIDERPDRPPPAQETTKRIGPPLPVR